MIAAGLLAVDGTSGTRPREKEVLLRVGRVKFERELAVIRQSGVHIDIERLLRPATAQAGKTTFGRTHENPSTVQAHQSSTGGLGRPRALPVDLFLTAALIAVSAGKATLTDIHRLLTRGLPRSYRIELGVTKQPPGGSKDTSITIRQVRYLLSAIAERLDTSTDRLPDLEQDEREDRQSALQRISDRILETTLPAHLPRPTTYAVDESAISTWARGRRRRRGADAGVTPPGLAPGSSASRHSSAPPPAAAIKRATGKCDVGVSFDIDAAWAYRTRTFDNGTDFFYGYQAIAASWAGCGLDLVERLTVAAGATNGVPEALAMIETWQQERQQQGQPMIKTLLSDRGFTYALPDNWAGPLHRLGIEQVMDIHPHDHGAEDHKGVKMIDGKPYHPAIPEHLRNIDRPPVLYPRQSANPDFAQKRQYDKNIRALVTFQELMAERAIYQLRRVNGPDANGTERFEFPCCVGKLRDPNCAFSMSLPDDVPLVTYPVTVKPLKHARTVTIKGNVQEKLRQRLTWGSPEWIAAYSKRTAIEGQFGNWKNTCTENVKRGWIRVVGLVKTTLMLTLAAASSNLRQLRAWADRNGDYTDPKTQLPPPDFGHEELDEHGNIAYATGYRPPAPPPQA